MPGQTDVASRAYRHAIHELAGTLRQCAQTPGKTNVPGMVYMLKNCQKHLETALSGQSVSEQEKQMILDLLVDEAINSMSDQDKSRLTDALHKGGINLMVLMQGLEADTSQGRSLLDGIVHSLQRNRQTFIYMPDLKSLSAELRTQLNDGVKQVKRAVVDYAEMKDVISEMQTQDSSRNVVRSPRRPVDVRRDVIEQPNRQTMDKNTARQTQAKTAKKELRQYIWGEQKRSRGDIKVKKERAASAQIKSDIDVHRKKREENYEQFDRHFDKKMDEAVIKTQSRLGRKDHQQSGLNPSTTGKTNGSK